MMYGWGSYGSFGQPWFGSIAVIFLFWSLFWKGIALWKSARSGEKYWFVGLLIINTLGLLEILYIFFFTKGEKGLPHWSGSAAAKQPAPTRRRAKK